ncbi:MAG: hypothetical protein RML49_03655 [Verrucomicrobiae bacterium]|nr:hypothetical protein [Verrucomicrobiae bacterium]
MASEWAEHDALEGLVERILAVKRANPAANTPSIERKIDEHVYRLCSQTPKAIRILEERDERSARPTLCILECGNLAAALKSTDNSRRTLNKTPTAAAAVQEKRHC